MTDFAPVTTYSPTIIDGPVIRWYRDLGHAEGRAAAISVSRDGVSVDAFIRTTADRDALLVAIERAVDVQGQILNGEDVSHHATHERARLGRLEEIHR
jgi:hypothetical protein